MNTSRSIQSAAFALALSITLATLGSLNLLAEDPHASGLLARAVATQQATVTQAAAANPRS